MCAVASVCAADGRADRCALVLAQCNPDHLQSHYIYPDEYLAVGDGLDAGWHHFMIVWNHDEPRSAFYVDAGKGGNDILTKSYTLSWPQEVAGKVSVGAWTSDEYEVHYCQAALFQLWIVDECLEPTDAVANKHLGLKPVLHS